MGLAPPSRPVFLVLVEEIKPRDGRTHKKQKLKVIVSWLYHEPKVLSESESLINDDFLIYDR